MIHNEAIENIQWDETFRWKTLTRQYKIHVTCDTNWVEMIHFRLRKWRLLSKKITFAWAIFLKEHNPVSLA